MNKEIETNPEEELGVRTAVDIVIFNSRGEVLLGKRQVTAGFGSWGFPGGHLKLGEKIKECAQREIKEELGEGIEIDLTNEVLGVRENSIAPYFLHHITILIKGDHVSGQPRVNEPDKCEEWNWFDLKQLPENLFSGVREILENYQDGKVLVVTDWEQPIS